MGSLRIQNIYFLEHPKNNSIILIRPFQNAPIWPHLIRHCICKNITFKNVWCFLCVTRKNSSLHILRIVNKDILQLHWSVLRWGWPAARRGTGRTIIVSRCLVSLIIWQQFQVQVTPRSAHGVIARLRTPSIVRKRRWKQVFLTRYYDGTLLLFSRPMRDKDTSALREMFQYSSLVNKLLDQCEIATHWRAF